MLIAALVLGALALLLALVALARSGGARRAIEQGDADLRRRLENARTQLSEEIEITRRLLAALAAGERLEGERIREGRLWGEIAGEQVARMLAEGNVLVIDVRTPGEVALGRIPGALLVPIEELEAREREIPRDGRVKILYCAGGARSAAACEFLARAGHERLYNLAGGFQSWGGEVARGP